VFRHVFVKGKNTRQLSEAVSQPKGVKRIVSDHGCSTNIPCLQHGGVGQIDHFFTSLEKATSVSDGF
jgi:hypothetical protein